MVFHWRKPQFYLDGYEVVTTLPLDTYIYINSSLDEFLSYSIQTVSHFPC